MRATMSKFGYHCRLAVGQVYHFFHRRQFSRQTTFYGIPHINRPDRLVCGEGLKVNGNVFINADGGVRIGNRVTLSYGSTILAVSYDIDQFFRGERVHKNRGVEIGNDVWIGANATILDGVRICDHVIVGAGAVVTKDISIPYSVFAGVPAKRIRSQDEI